MRTPKSTPAANRLYLQAVALLRRIPAGEKQRTRRRAQDMTLAALRQAAKARTAALAARDLPAAG